MGWFKKIKKAVKKVAGVAKDVSGVVNVLGDIAGAKKQSSAIRDAADIAAQSGQYAQDVQERMFNRQTALQEPFRQSGLQAQNRMNELLGLGKSTGSNLYGRYARDFSLQDFEADPGYAFRMSEGLKSLDRQAAARGGLISGGALKAAQMYGQDLGSQEYMNAFNRYQTNRANQLNPLQSLLGVGQTSTNALGGAAQAYGSGGQSALMTSGANAGNIAMTGGANQANAYLTKGNIAASQYGNYGSALDQAISMGKPGKDGGLSDWATLKGFFS
jgi:hypothetical protein